MNIYVAALIAITFWLALPSDSDKAGGVVHLKDLEGEWLLRKVTVLAPEGSHYAEFADKDVAGGMKITTRSVDKSVTSPGEEYATIEADFKIQGKRIKSEHAVIIRPRGTFSEIDVVEAGKENKGICELKYDTLTKCSTTNWNHKRPTRFSGSTDEVQIVTIWEKQRAPRKADREKGTGKAAVKGG